MMPRATSELSGQARVDTTDPPGAAERRDIDAPTDLRARSWGGALRRSVREFREDNLTDWAAALTLLLHPVDLSRDPGARLNPGRGGPLGHATADRKPGQGGAGARAA